MGRERVGKGERQSANLSLPCQILSKSLEPLFLLEKRDNINEGTAGDWERRISRGSISGLFRNWRSGGLSKTLPTKITLGLCHQVRHTSLYATYAMQVPFVVSDRVGRVSFQDLAQSIWRLSGLTILGQRE